MFEVQTLSNSNLVTSLIDIHTMVTSDFKPEVEIWLFCTCAM